MRSAWVALIALGCMMSPALAQQGAPLPEREAVVEAIASKDHMALTGMVGSVVEVAKPEMRDLAGMWPTFQVIERLSGCVALDDPNAGAVNAIFIDYDCPTPEGFVIGADCVSEDWELHIVPRGASEIKRTGIATPIAVLAPLRSNEGACYRRPTAPPVAAPSGGA